METENIIFPSGNRARVVYPSALADGEEIAAALGLARQRGALLVHGGAKELSDRVRTRLKGLFLSGVAQLAVEENLTIVTGGTASGVAQLIGEGYALAGGHAPLIGICPAARVNWPGKSAAVATTQLESHHTHFVLTPGDRWGAETSTMFTLASALTRQVPSIAIVANGGPVTQREFEYNIQQRRQIMVIDGSGRFADTVVAAIRHDERLLYRGTSEPIDTSLVSVFDITSNGVALAREIRARLFTSPVDTQRKGGESER